MPCPYLEEVSMRYCKAYPIKKMIPASSSQLVSPCFSNCSSCPVYQDVRGKKFSPKIKAREPSCAGMPQACQSEQEQKYCVWSRQEVVSYRLCTHNYDCQSCQFEQMLIEQDGKYAEPPQVVAEIERLRKLPADQRRCKYMVTGKILLESCHLDYECWKCSMYQKMRTSIVENYIAEAKKVTT